MSTRLPAKFEEPRPTHPRAERQKPTPSATHHARPVLDDDDVARPGGLHRARAEVPRRSGRWRTWAKRNRDDAPGNLAASGEPGEPGNGPSQAEPVEGIGHGAGVEAAEANWN
jgi:hypothetical protein